MIQWKKVDRNNMPSTTKQYLIFNGHVYYGYLERKAGFLSWFSEGEIIKYVTYYAEINLPEATGTTESAKQSEAE